ncbi:Plancitoxin-1 [Trichinella sp. T9]|nr:Plancitoxin-1 [Trichinella sp. T9]
MHDIADSIPAATPYSEIFMKKKPCISHGCLMILKRFGNVSKSKMTLRKNFNVHNMCIFLLWFTFPNHSAATTKCQNLNGNAPAQPRGMTLIAGGGAVNWVVNPADVIQMAGHSFGKVLEHVIDKNAANKFIAYNNIPPDVPKVNTKSNSKGLLMMNPQDPDEASWIVHTVPGFPKALRGYLFPPEEIQKGHLFICLTIKESEIDAIAMALRIVTPLIYHNDIPDTEINSRPNLKKLVNGESRLTPPLTVTRQISTAAAAGLKVTIYSKSEKSKYEIYRRVLVKKLKTSIKVWTTRDKTLKSDCRILNRNIKLVTSPITIGGHASSLESDVSQWLISDPGNKFCAVDKPYHKSQAKEPAIAVCIDDATIFGHFNRIAPGQNIGKAFTQGNAGAWGDTAVVTGAGGHSFGKALEHVIAVEPTNKFIAYNNVPPDIPKPKTNSNSKVNGESRFIPPLTVARDISTAAPGGLKVTIYSKGEKSRFAPGQNIGKAFTQGNAGAWGDTAVVTGAGGHSFGKALEHVIAVEPTNKFIAYNNVPPDIPKPKTKSNSKGVLMMNPQGADEAAWIVHTVPGFPKALRGYLFPPEEIQKGHLFICLTIKESEIDTIAMTMRIATPLIYHNDIPDSEINSRPNLKKLVNGESRFIPPLTVARDISTAAPGGLKVTIYSKGEKSRFEIYRRILVRKLKTTIKIWTTRDKTLKSDCRIFGRNIRLVTSPISVSGHPSSLESDVSQWLISEQGNKFCAVDKPYQKSQTKEPAMAVCIDDASIFTRFNEIAANLDDCT